MKPTTLLWCAAIVAACANVTHSSPAALARLAEARAMLADDPNGALQILDGLLRESPRWSEARRLAADGAFRMAQTANRGRAELLQDAVRDLGIGLDGVSPDQAPESYRLLADCQFELGAFAPAAEAARDAARGFASRGTMESRQQAAAAVLLAADADLRQFISLRQPELDTGERQPNGDVVPAPAVATLAAQVEAQLASVRVEHPAAATQKLALLWQYLQRPAQATAEFERGLRLAPNDGDLHRAFVDWMVSRNEAEALVGTYAGFAKELPGNPTVQWYLARSQFARADQLRMVGNHQAAISAYGKAMAGWGEYVAMAPNDAANANVWLALCELSAARVAVEIGDFAAAERHLFAADTRSPSVLVYEDGVPQVMDSFRSHFTGVVFALNRALAESGPDGIEKALAFNERVIARHPDRWGFVYNNAALPARDLGVRLADEGKLDAAKELWERSFRYYEKAVALSPDDARIVNDCGLMLIYHLDRDFPRAKQLFEQAIAIGTRQLEALDPTTDRRDRELLEEAVGDAWQNLAILARKHLHQPFAEYRGFCENAVRYYPYERRSAAALLRSEGRDDGENPTVAAALQGNAAEALAKVRPTVQEKVAQGDFDGALTELDGITKECKDHAPFHALRGEVTLGLARQAASAGRKGAEFFFQDAVAALKKAVSLDGEPIQPRLLLGEALYAANDLEGAAAAASSLLLHLQSKGGGKTEEQQATHRLRAEAGARAYAAKKSEGKDDADLLAGVRTSFRALEQAAALTAEQRTLWSTTEQWAGAGAEAVNIFARALAKSPDDQALLGGLVDTAAATKQLGLAADALGKRDDATGLWYLGKVRFLQAAAEREAGKNTEALQILTTARQCFAASKQKNAGFAATCDEWTAWCLGKMGNIAFRTEDMANAETWLLEAVKVRPDTIETDLGLGESIKMGVLLLADKYFRKQDLGKVESIYRRASDAATRDLDLLNNSGLFARDYGNVLERSGKATEAKDMYEQSYKAYRLALQLDGKNVRLRNDCALIAIHHLERDWELTKQMLDEAIADGQRTLADNPPSDVDEKQRLDEAVGDCYENLALWQIRHGKDYQAAKAAAEQSLKHHPGSRRPGARRHLQEAERLLQGK